MQLRLFTQRHYLCFLRAWVNSEGKGVIPNAELSFENNMEEQNRLLHDANSPINSQRRGLCLMSWACYRTFCLHMLVVQDVTARLLIAFCILQNL